MSRDPSKGKDRGLQRALLKLSTANAFVRARRASGAGGLVDVQASEPSTGCDPGPFGAGPSFSLDDFPLAELSPEQRSPYYGLYADYEEVMELLHTSPVADESARRYLGGLSRQQVVHVAHLGLGACCSVDLVALHTPDGGRLLAAAKSCYLPPSDPRARASLREAELLRRCAGCPFIIHLLALLQEPPEPMGAAASAGAGVDAAASWGPAYSGAGGAVDAGAGGGSGPASPRSASPRDSLRRESLSRLSSGPYGGGGEGGGVAGPSGRFGDERGGGMDAQLAAMQASPAYQAWMQWRGGGGADDLQRQILSRLSAASASASAPAGFGSVPGGGGVSLARDDSFSLGAVRLGSVPGDFGAGPGSFTTGGHDSSPILSCNGLYGGGWALGGGGAIGTVGFGGSGATSGSESGAGKHAHARAGGRQLLRRGSMEIIDMYRGCSALGGGAQTPGLPSAPAAPPGASGGEVGSPRAEPPAMTTLLLSWARCGDLRRLVQLMMSRSPVHSVQGKAGGHGGPAAVAALPPLMPEECARFYTGCLVLALEHLHVHMHTVHRDLKLANLLLMSSGYAVVGDLGTAVDLSTVPGGRLNARVGSPGHMAPECRDRDVAGYDTSADMWSLGACLYSLLTGHLPAGTAGPPNRSWVPPLSRHWSRELQDLLCRLLAWSPAQRPTAAQLMKDPWFRGFNWGALRAEKMPAPSSTPWRELLWWPKENRHLL